MRTALSLMLLWSAMWIGPEGTIVHADDGVTDLVLVNAGNGKDLRKLKNGDRVSLDEGAGGVTVRAQVSGRCGSVVFSLDDQERYRVENTAPYVLTGDSNGRLGPWTVSSGPHIIVATPYPQRDGRGAPGRAVRVSLTVVDTRRQPEGEWTGAVPLPTGGRGWIRGELKKWHRITLTFDGPSVAENRSPNPFLAYRLLVTFRHENRVVVVPGFFAADGRAADTSATAGDQWRVHFCPDAEGEWRYRASFRAETNIAVDVDPEAGKPTAFDGASGSFTVAPSDKRGRDFRARGLLRYAGSRYLRFAESDEPYVKGGADSPENFLAYFEFDQTPPTHKYAPHARDWRPGDPTWGADRGKNIIGALDYLASQGMNSVYFLTMNVRGDGKDVWPWTDGEERYRFDCSKLDQWERVFAHMDKLGLVMHVITQEQENDQLLDGGELGLQRKLYYRELIARFGHHLGLVWNLGEENTNTDEQRKEFCRYIRALDPYDHPIVVHTFPRAMEKVYSPLLGFGAFEGASLQIGGAYQRTHEETLRWIQRSREAGRPWFVCLDEVGPAQHGVLPDAEDADHDDMRQHVLWGNLMAGGAGVEWYFGYRHPHNDLNCEDWRSREQMWRQTRFALEWFRLRLPFSQMAPADDLTKPDGVWCIAKRGEVYAVYLPVLDKADVQLDLTDAAGSFAVAWFQPRSGSGPLRGSVETLRGGEMVHIGAPPSTTRAVDWVVLVKKQPE